MVPYLTAFLIFAGMATGCWFVSVTLYRGTVGTPDPAAAPRYQAVAAAAIGFATLTSFLPFPYGWYAAAVGWAAAAFAGLGLPPRRAAVLFAFLAAGSIVTRLLILGVMGMFDL